MNIDDAFMGCLDALFDTRCAAWSELEGRTNPEVREFADPTFRAVALLITPLDTWCDMPLTERDIDQLRQMAIEWQRSTGARR